MTLSGNLVGLKTSSFRPAAPALNPWWRSDILKDKSHLCRAQGNTQPATPWGTEARLTQEKHSHGWPRSVPGCCPGRQENQQAKSCPPCPASQGQWLSPKAGKRPPRGCDSAGCPALQARPGLTVPGNTLLLYPLAFGRRVIDLAAAQLSSWLEQGRAEIFSRPAFSPGGYSNGKLLFERIKIRLIEVSHFQARAFSHLHQGYI